tara:strand:+ start:768 stop:956 length:189 start_codon:yes stop_codon:yes gene_type:complete
LKEGDLIRVIDSAPRPWASQVGIVLKRQFFFHRESKVMVYLFKLKEKVPISMDNVILISEVK